MRFDLFAIGWAAGLFEGEGCIDMAGHHRGIRLTLSSTDFDVIERFAEIVGVGRVRPSRTSDLGVKPMLQWQVNGDPAAEVLRELMPYLGARRLARAEEVFAIRAAWIESQTAARECPGCGTVFRPIWGTGSASKRYCEYACRDRHNQRLRYHRRRAARLERTG
jgi:hypothetical protein